MGDLIKDFTARAFARLGQAGGDASPWNKTPREGLAMVKEHLGSTYGLAVRSLAELDAGVFKVVHDDGTWIARVFSAARPVEAAEGDAAVLRHLEAHGFPAERCAREDAVSTLDGRGVLVTTYVEGAHVENDAVSTERVGELLGRLHTMPLPDADSPAARSAGSWHHITHAGGPRSADAVALRPLMRVAMSPERSPVHLEKHFESVIEELDAIDDGVDLPQSMVHIDLGGPNVIDTGDGLVGVDWAGAGVGARITSLAALASTEANPKLVDAFVSGYRRHVELEPEELDRLAGAVRAHSLVLDAWMMVFAPAYADHVVNGLAAKRDQCKAIAARVREAYQHAG